MVSTEEILLERPRAPGSKAEEPKVAGDPLAALGKGGAVLMVCRTCGKKGDHWTSKCPYKDLASQTESFMIDKPPTSETTAATSSSVGGNKGGAYVPPGMRGGGERSSVPDRRRNEENSVRVTNLSEDTRELDLLELFRPFGAVSRVYVPIDQKTGMSRGFGFVNFVNKEDAEKAIFKLNGYGYDNLILRVELATSSSVGGNKGGAYVPPGMRGGGERSSVPDRRRNEENSVRVTNLPEDTREPDLLELFRPFGAVSRVYVAIDQKTGMSRGFGFVNFVNKEDAEKAIFKLNGYGYDNLILRVELATPRAAN